MKNEARFLIAYYNTLLVEIYGPVPFNPTKLLSGESTSEEIMAGQTPYDQIVDWIDKDLLELSTKLPASYTQKEVWSCHFHLVFGSKSPFITICRKSVG